MSDSEISNTSPAKPAGSEQHETPASQLCRGAILGRIDLIDTALLAGADPNEFCGPFSPLMYASTREAVQALVSSGAEVNATSPPSSTAEGGTTALMVAAHYNRPEVVTALLKAGAEPTICAENGATAFTIAIIQGSQPCADLVYAAGGGRLIYERAAAGNVDAVRAALEGVHNIPGDELTRALHLAATMDRAEVCAALLNAGVSPIAESHGNLPAHTAAYRLSIRSLKIFLDSGVSPNVTTSRGRSLIKQCLSGPNSKVERRVRAAVQLLLEYGADPNLGDPVERSPLTSACYWGYLSVMRLLLEYGADPNRFTEAPDPAQSSRPTFATRSPLVGAVIRKDAACARLLLEFGADPGLRNNTGERAIDVADLLLARDKCYHRKELEAVRAVLAAVKSKPG